MVEEFKAIAATLNQKSVILIKTMVLALCYVDSPDLVMPEIKDSKWHLAWHNPQKDRRRFNF